MNNYLIPMIDGGIVNYSDDAYHFDGCPTCDYGSEYINVVDIKLTKYNIHFKLNQMYKYVLSEGMMIKFFLTENDTIKGMTETEFTEWFKLKLPEMVHDDFKEAICGRCIEEFVIQQNER